MNPNNEHGLSLNNGQEHRLDSSVMRRIIRRRWPIWALYSFAVYTISVVIGLFLMPQTYSSMLSISMQQSNMAASPLAALAGGASTRKYLGVLRSRRFAEKVDEAVHFRELLNLSPTPANQEEAIDRVIHDLKVEDNTSDGLLYVTVSLPGPPRLGPDPTGRRERLRAAVALAANKYGETLQNYLKDADTDKELTLLRSADGQVSRAEQNYNLAVGQLIAFVRNSRLVAAAPASSGTGSPGQSPDATGSMSQLQSLYVRRGQLEVQMKSQDAIIVATRGLLTNPKTDITTLPYEDPLLNVARRDVLEAATAVENLQITFGSSMQSVRRAQERLNLAQARLHREVQSILNGNTTDQVKRRAMQVEYETVQRQIDVAEQNFQSSRVVGTEVERRRNAVALQLEVLKATLTRYAELKMQTVSAQNRMAIVDKGLPPRHSKPGMGLIAAVCLLVPAAFVGTWLAVEYQMSSRLPTPLRTAVVQNGAEEEVRT